MMGPNERRQFLLALDRADAVAMRRTLYRLFEYLEPRVEQAEKSFAKLTPRQLGEACVSEELLVLLAGKITPCAQRGCDLPEYMCAIHRRGESKAP